MAEQIIMPKADWVAGLNKIRERGGATGPIKSGEFEAAVANIPQGGATLEKRDLTGFPYTSNGIKIIKPSPGYDGMSEVKVSLQVPAQSKLQTLDLGTIDFNGPQIVYPDVGYDGISRLDFDVQVPTGGGELPPGITRVVSKRFIAPGGTNRIPVEDITGCKVIIVYCISTSLISGEFTSTIMDKFPKSIYNSLYGANFYAENISGSSENGLCSFTSNTEIQITDFNYSPVNFKQGREYGVVQFY